MTDDQLEIRRIFCDLCGFSACSQDPERSLLYYYEHCYYAHNVADLQPSETDPTLTTDAQCE